MSGTVFKLCTDFNQSVKAGQDLLELDPALTKASIAQNESAPQVSMSMFGVILAFGFSAAIGVFFGFYPARRAAALKPVEALGMSSALV